MSNRFGTLYSLTSFGESHGKAIGGVIDGCPAGIPIDMDAVAHQMSRRRPGQNGTTTGRCEQDNVVFLSGLLNNVTTGTAIGFYVENTDCRPEDYDSISNVFRPGHADYTYFKKYNGFNDVRGGGRSSARETVSRVVAGEIARQVLNVLCPGINVRAYTQSVGDIFLEKEYTSLDLTSIDSNPVRCPDHATAQAIERLINDVRAHGDSVGGIVRCVVSGVPTGLGEPVFDKFSASLASAMMSINAAKGFEFGAGFAASTKLGSQIADEWIKDDTDIRGIRTNNNFSGGIQGGITNGEDIVFNVAFKPVASISKELSTVDRAGNETTIKIEGRHDPCVVPRAVPIVEAMTEMVLLDHLLIDRARRL